MRISGSNIDSIHKAAKIVNDVVRSVSGTTDVRLSSEEGKPKRASSKKTSSSDALRQKELEDKMFDDFMALVAKYQEAGVDLDKIASQSHTSRSRQQPQSKNENEINFSNYSKKGNKLIQKNKKIPPKR